MQRKKNLINQYHHLIALFIYCHHNPLLSSAYNLLYVSFSFPFNLPPCDGLRFFFLSNFCEYPLYIYTLIYCVYISSYIDGSYFWSREPHQNQTWDRFDPIHLQLESNAFPLSRTNTYLNFVRHVACMQR